MSTKKVQIGTKPTSKPAPVAADAWVDNRIREEREEMKRLTFDVPASLHRAIKTSCAMRGTKIADEVRQILAERYLKK